MKRNDFAIEGDYARVYLNKGYSTLIDLQDLGRTLKYRWHAYESLRRDGTLRTVYAKGTVLDGTGSNKSTPLHRYILDATKDKQVDHISCDGLDNRRSNLRSVRPQLNSFNRRHRNNSKSPYKGVSYLATMKEGRQWKAVITVERKPWLIGYFSTPEEAAGAYDTAARRFFQKYARLNFPQEGEQSALVA